MSPLCIADLIVDGHKGKLNLVVDLMKDLYEKIALIRPVHNFGDLPCPFLHQFCCVFNTH